MSFFLDVAAPWIRIGGTCLPLVPGEKAPAVAGWGRRGTLALRWCGVAGPLHSWAGPRLPRAAYEWMGAVWPSANVLVFPATVGCTVVDVDDLSKLEAVLRVLGDTPYRVTSGREGGGIHLWYAGVVRSRNAIAPGIDLKSEGGYVIAPGSVHPKTGAPYVASPELAAALAAGRLPHARPRSV